jgi:Mrp family chromosome partitioning ATPase
MEKQISMEERQRELVEKEERLKRNMRGVKHKITVMNDRGGGGKSTVT